MKKRIAWKIIKPILLILIGFTLACISIVISLFNLFHGYHLLTLFIVALIVGTITSKKGWLYCLIIAAIEVISLQVLRWFILARFVQSPIHYSFMQLVKEVWNASGNWELVWISCLLFTGITGGLIGGLFRYVIKRNIIQ